MIASEKSGRSAERRSGRSAFLEEQVHASMRRLLELGGASVRSATRTIHGTPLHYLDAGQGPGMVLLHGAGGGAANWYRLIAKLSERYRVIAVDLPGFGLSGAIHPKAPVGRQVAGLVAQLLDQVDVAPSYIVGTSFGGLVAARLAQITEPQRLVLIDSAGLWPDAALYLRLVCNRVLQRVPVKSSRAGVRWLFRNIMTASLLPHDHEEALIDYLYWTAARSDRRALARAYMLFAGLAGQREVLSAADFASLASRTLLLWGERDRFLPAPPARRDAALAAGAQLRIIPGVGHSPTWEAPDVVLHEIMQFIN